MSLVENNPETALSETEALIFSTGEKYRNWGKWGGDDQLGTLNYITLAKITEAAGLVRKGRVFALAMPLDMHGPQNGGLNRFNPIHTMLTHGADYATGHQHFPHSLGYADDMLTLPLQCATQWDALSHVFDRGQMWNGYPAHEVNSRGAGRNGIEQATARIVSRGVLLDIARYKGVKALEPGYAITETDLLGCIEAQGATARVTPGDIVLIRTGQLEQARTAGWGSYAGGDAPGLSFYSADWLFRSQIAAIASDTWGLEVRPNELPGSFQPLHQIMIPNIGLTVGEMFELDELAADCASDGVYEFMLIAPPLPVTGAVGSPINPQVIK